MCIALFCVVSCIVIAIKCFREPVLIETLTTQVILLI
jgi:hypothetical protein